MNLIEQFTASPSSFPEEHLDTLAAEVRTRILEVVSKNGGHLASSLGAVELTIALLRVFDATHDRIVWDVGHQTYAWKILTGRNLAFESLRKFGGLSGFPRRDESPSDAFIAGHAGTAISGALGLAAARDRTAEEKHQSVVAVVGDASITNGIALEGLNNAIFTTKRFILILNDNRMSISKNVGAMSRHFGTLLASRRYNKAKTHVENLAKRLRLHWLSNFYHRLESMTKSLFVRNIVFEDLGFRYIGPLEGHNISRLTKALTIARDYHRPIVLHIATQKGRGYAPAEENPSAWHGVGPFDLSQGAKPKEHGKPADYSKVFGTSLVNLAKDNESIVAITAAMRLGTGLDSFAKQFPNRFFDVGISEEHAVTFAAGLAAGGAHPVVALYSTFAQRAVDCVYHDVCLQHLPVTICLDRAGVVGADGMTHHGLYDIALFRAMPGLIFAQPRDGEMMQRLLAFATLHNGPVILRYPRGLCPAKVLGMKSDHASLVSGKAEVIRHPQKTMSRTIWIWVLGDLLATAQTIAEELERLGIAGVGIVDPIFIKPLDVALLQEEIDAGAEIVTLENGVLQGGFGSAVREVITPPSKIHCFGFGDVPVEHGTQAELLAQAGLDAASIIKGLCSDHHSPAR